MLTKIYEFSLLMNSCFFTTQGGFQWSPWTLAPGVIALSLTAYSLLFIIVKTLKTFVDIVTVLQNTDMRPGHPGTKRG